MTDVRLQRLTLRLATHAGLDGRRLAEAVGAALAALGSLPATSPVRALRVRLSRDAADTEQALAARIATEVLRAASQVR